jgi:pilus assembly protein CpaC
MKREDHVMFPAPIAPSGRSLFGQTLRLAAVALAAGVTLGLAPFALSPAQGAETTHLKVSGSFGTTRMVTLDVNKSMLIDLPIDVQEVIVSQPGVANAILRSKRRAIIQAVGSGETNIFFLDAAGRTIVVLDVSTKGTASTAGVSVAAVLRDTYAKVIPNSNIEVEAVTMINADGGTVNRIVLSGKATSADDATKALTIAQQFAGSADNVTSVMSIAGSQQVMLKVTVAEIRREVAKDLGINLASTFSIGGVSGSFGNPMTDIPNGVEATLPVNMPFGSADITIAMRALESKGALRMLAEPVLVAMSGQEATFRVGGELPYITYDSDGNPVTAFKDYGIDLAFTPVIKSGGVIGLTVATEVSEPTGSAGALNSREVSTNVELGVGQTLSIAGLLDERTSQEISKLPGIGDIPILGTLFRSRAYSTLQTELVFLVTPYMAQPADGRPELPTDRTPFANDAEAIFLGNVESIYGVGPAGTRGSYDGSVGFLLD